MISSRFSQPAISAPGSAASSTPGYAPGRGERLPAGAVITEPTTFRAYARTLTDLLGLAPLDSTRETPSMLTK